MSKVIRFWKVFFIDLLGVLCLIAAPITGPIPGPGGIPLFLLGLSLLAINHDWAQRYIDLTKEYADKIGQIIFVDNPKIQWFYDISSSFIIGLGLYLAWLREAWWQLPLSTVLIFTGLTFLLGNRNRWTRFKSSLKRKH